MALLLVACKPSDTPEAIFENYLYRLSNSLEVENNTQQYTPTPLVAYPSSRDLSFDITSGNINLLEFLKLSSCELQRHIGYRNSSLGRVMEPSQRLLYEYQFITLADQCLSVIDRSNTLYTVLSDTLQQKRQNLNKAQWNAVFGSQEFQTLFSLGTQPLTISSSNSNPIELYAALEKIQHFIGREQTHHHDQSIEQAYAVIASSKKMGEVRLAMQLSQDYLFLADSLLDKSIADKQLCRQGQATRQFDIVKTVFLKFYIGDIQPYLSHLHKQTQQLLQYIDTLADLPLSKKMTKKEFSIFWQAVYRSDHSEWQRFNQAVRQHTKHWQALLKQCGHLPK